MKNIGNKPVMAKNIRRYMKEKGINAKDLSKAIGVPYTTVLSWANSEYYPRIDKIDKMSEYFGCLKSDLIEEQKKEPAGADELSSTKRELLDLVSELSDSEAAVLLASLKSALGKP